MMRLRSAALPAAQECKRVQRESGNGRESGNDTAANERFEAQR